MSTPVIHILGCGLMENWYHWPLCPWHRGERTRWRRIHWPLKLPPRNNIYHFCSHFLGQNKLHIQAWHPEAVEKYNRPTGAHQISLSSNTVYDIPHTKLVASHVCDGVAPPAGQFSFRVDASSRKGFNTGIIFSYMHLFRPWHQIANDLNIPSQEHSKLMPVLPALWSFRKS